jgi:hypothetical protein
MFVEAEECSTLSQEQLEDELAAQAAHVEAGVCRLLELVAECERRLTRTDEGTTFAGWLAWRCSLSPRQAREYERVGTRLAELPLIHGAFSRGELSFAKVSVLTRVAEPQTEERLLELAEALSASQLERAAGAYRQLAREDAAGLQEREFVRYHWAGDGSLALRARLASEDGALVLRALEAGRTAVWVGGRREARAADPSPPAGAASAGEPARPSNAAAFVAMADLALAGSGCDRTGGDRHPVVVHVDAAVLARRGDGRCELADGPRLAAETAQRLSCDASIVESHERDGDVLSLGRKRRTLSPALRRALAARDRGCRFPGCGRTRFVDGHHVRHWSEGGETSLGNLVSLCRRHHRLVHERGYSVRLDAGGEVRFENRHGIVLENVPRPPPASSPAALPDRHRRSGLLIDGRTGRTGTGDRMELALAADAIASIVAAAR